MIPLLSTQAVFFFRSRVFFEFAEEFRVNQLLSSARVTFKDVNMLAYHPVIETMLMLMFAVWYLLNMQPKCFGVGVAPARVFNMKDRVYRRNVRRGSVTGI